MFYSGNGLCCYACSDVLCCNFQTRPNCCKSCPNASKRGYAEYWEYWTQKTVDWLYLPLRWQQQPWLHLRSSVHPCPSSSTLGWAYLHVFSHVAPTPCQRDQPLHTPRPLMRQSISKLQDSMPNDHTRERCWLCHLETGWLWRLLLSPAWQHGGL